MPIQWRGNEVTNVRYDNEEQDVLRYRGNIVFQSIEGEWVDRLNYSDLTSRYWIEDEGQSDLPRIGENVGVNGGPGIVCPYDSPNTIVSLRDDHSEYNGSVQPALVDNYPYGSGVFDFHLSLDEIDQFRIISPIADYDQSNGIRFRLHHNYARIEEVINGEWEYYGDDPQESYPTFSSGSDLRVVIDYEDWPDVQYYIWEEGSLEVSLETTGASPELDSVEPGFGFWWNDSTAVTISRMRLIEREHYEDDL